MFRPSALVPGGFWTRQKGLLKVRTNVAVQVPTDEELNWAKVNVSNWDPPDSPTPLPQRSLYDAEAVLGTRPPGGAAKRDTVRCPACLAIKNK